jgi:hypothetical protein
MARAASSDDVLSRVRREQRMRGKSTRFSGLRIVFTATAITLAILLFAFGAIGMLMMARSPQEPIASKLEQAPYVAPQAQVPAEPEVVVPERVVLPSLPEIAPPTQAELEKGFATQQPVPQVEPETTASLPSQPEEAEQPQPRVQRNVVRPRPQYRQQQVQRRPIQNSQDQNPLFQLFGIKQYR